MYELDYFSLLSNTKPLMDDLFLLAKLFGIIAICFWLGKKIYLITQKKEELLSLFLKLFVFLFILFSWKYIYVSAGLLSRVMESVVYSYSPAQEFKINDSLANPQHIGEVLQVMSSGIDGQKLLELKGQVSDQEYTSNAFNFSEDRSFSENMINWGKRYLKNNDEVAKAHTIQGNLDVLENKGKSSTLIEWLINGILNVKDLILFILQATFLTYYLLTVPIFFVVSYMPVIGDGNDDSQGLAKSAVESINSAMNVIFWPFYLALCNQIFVIIYYILRTNDNALVTDLGPRITFLVIYIMASVILLFSARKIPAYGIVQGTIGAMTSLVGGTIVASSLIARSGFAPMKMMSSGLNSIKSNFDMVNGGK